MSTRSLDGAVRWDGDGVRGETVVPDVAGDQAEGVRMGHQGARADEGVDREDEQFE